MKKLRSAAAALACFTAVFMLEFSAFAAVYGPNGEFTEEDRRIFGIFPIWAFLLLLAGIVMVVIIIIVEIFKRKMK